MNEARVSWKSDHLQSVALSTLPPEMAKARIRAIIDQIYSPKSELGRELDIFFQKRFNDGPAWLSDYYRAYEMFYFSPRYLALAGAFHAALPTEGRIIDLGSGTGGLSGILADLSPGRSFMLVDHDQALTIAEDRMRFMFPGADARFSLVREYVNPKSRLPDGPFYDAALINHTLYTMSRQTKLAALRALSVRLKPNATVVINEPLHETASLPSEHRAWLTEMIEDAILGGAPHTEFDIAVLAAICSGRITQLTRMGPMVLPLMTEGEHEALFQGLGWTITKKEISYAGFSRMWVLKTK